MAYNLRNPSSSGAVQLSLRITKELSDKLLRGASVEGVTLSDFARSLLEGGGGVDTDGIAMQLAILESKIDALLSGPTTAPQSKPKQAESSEPVAKDANSAAILYEAALLFHSILSPEQTRFTDGEMARQGKPATSPEAMWLIARQLAKPKAMQDAEAQTKAAGMTPWRHHAA